MAATHLPARHGRPRDPSIDEAVLTATIAILSEDGYRHLSTTEVARRAGVHKPAVYRRWPTKLELALAAIHRLAPPIADPDTGDVRRDLVDVLLQVASAKQRRPHLELAARLRSDFATEPELASAVRAAIIRPRVAAMRSIIERAQRRGELRADVGADAVTDLLFGAVNARSLRTDAPLTRAAAVRLVDVVIDGIAVAATEPRGR